MNTVGKNITLTFFGESHSPYIGVTIDHLPPGIEINNQLINFNLGKRRPKSIGSTSRIELDEYEFISGIKNNITTGAPLTALIKNKDIPGALASILSILRTGNVNISNLSLIRSDKINKTAICVIELDSKPLSVIIDKIKELEIVYEVSFMKELEVNL